MRYIVRGYKKYTRKLQESAVFKSYNAALHEAQEFVNSNQYKIIIILRDTEGVDHIDNAGKFFLFSIIK